MPWKAAIQRRSRKPARLPSRGGNGRVSAAGEAPLSARPHFGIVKGRGRLLAGRVARTHIASPEAYQQVALYAWPERAAAWGDLIAWNNLHGALAICSAQGEVIMQRVCRNRFYIARAIMTPPRRDIPDRALCLARNADPGCLILSLLHTPKAVTL